MTDFEQQILINFGPVVAFLVLWAVLHRLITRRQGGAVAVVKLNTEEMRRLNANIERLIEAFSRRAEAGGDRHG